MRGFVLLCAANKSHREELDFMLFVLEVSRAYRCYHMFCKAWSTLARFLVIGITEVYVFNTLKGSVFTSTISANPGPGQIYHGIHARSPANDV